MAAASTLSRFLGRTVSEGAAFAFGVAVGPVLAPPVQDLKNVTWSLHPDAPLSHGEAAAIVAEDVEKQPWGEKEASYTGLSKARFDALLDEVRNAPGIGELLAARRRGIATNNAEGITAAEFKHGLRKAKLETLWDDALVNLLGERLDPAVIANAIVRGLIPDPGILPVGPPTERGSVPSFPVFNVDALAEAQASGIDRERLSVMVGLDGRPMSLHEAASAYFRGIIERSDYERAVAEGDTRNEWREAILEQAREIPSVTNYVEAFVRNWISRTDMEAGAAKHGMSADDANLLFLVHGRPLSWHQVFIGLRRGGVYNGPTAEIDPAFLKALQESDIRPEWYSIAWAQRFSYPSAFVLKAMTKDGDLTAAETETILLYEGWEPGLAKLASEKWAGGGTAPSQPLVRSHTTSAVRVIAKAYITGGTNEADARAALTELSVSPAEQDGLVKTWDVERGLRSSALTVVGVKADYKAGTLSRTDAILDLQTIGLTEQAANVELDT